MSSEYDVGYAKPPKAGRFKMGRSGNPKGRPKLLGGPLRAAAETLLARKTVTINGETKKIYAIQLRQILAIDAACQGDLKPLQAYFRQEADMIRRINAYIQMRERQQAPAEERGDPDIERMLRSSPFLQEYHARTEEQRIAALAAIRASKPPKKIRLPKFDVTVQMGAALLETIWVGERRKRKCYRKMDLIAKLAHEPSKKRDPKFLTQYYEIEPHLRSHVEAYLRSHQRSGIPRSKEEQAKVAQAIRSRVWDIVDFELAEEQRQGRPKVSTFERAMRFYYVLRRNNEYPPIYSHIPLSGTIDPRSDRPPPEGLVSDGDAEGVASDPPSPEPAIPITGQPSASAARAQVEEPSNSTSTTGKPPVSKR